MKKHRSLVLVMLFVVGIVTAPLSLFVERAAAASLTSNYQSQLVFDTDDNPVLNDDPATTATFVGAGISHGSDGGSGQTTSDSNLNQIYTWRLPELTDSICSHAQLTSLHITANVTADTEGNPDLSALMLYRIDGSSQYNLGDYTVQQGVDYATSTGFFTPPDNDGVYGAVRGSASVFGGQLTGQLEATWDLSSYDPTDQFGIMVQQDSQDGSVNLRTAIQDVELTYDNANCVYDGSATKTLLNPSSVHPGGQATYEITVTNKGNEPLPFNAAEDRGIYDIYSPSLTYASVSSDDVDVICTHYGTLGDVFSGDPSSIAPYQNHTDYDITLCASQSSAVMQPGDSWKYRVTFTVGSDATNITNMVSWPLVFDNAIDPGLVPFVQAIGDIEPGGPDLIDLIMSGNLTSDNVSVISYDFPAESASAATDKDGQLAYTGTPTIAFAGLGAITLIAGIHTAHSRRRYMHM